MSCRNEKQNPCSDERRLEEEKVSANRVSCTEEEEEQKKKETLREVVSSYRGGK